MKTLPNFSLPDQNGVVLTPADLLGQWTVLYAYPKDLTPGCTTEAKDFTTLAPQFHKIKARVIGISPDTSAKHCRFIEKESLKLTLLSDTEHVLIEALGAWQMKKFMGREGMGVIRSTWLIDPQGQIRAVWSPVKVTGHAQEVLDTLKTAMKE